MTARPRVLFISPDAVGTRMAGLGIRYTELALALRDVATVRVATGAPDPGGPGTLPQSDVVVVGYDPHAPSALREQIAWADTVVAPPQWPVVTRWLRTSGVRVVIDLYDPETLETLELFAGRRALERRLMVALTQDRLDDALRVGHHFMCASEGQRDLWLGALLATRAITPALYDADRSLRSVVDLVPFGLPAARPVASGGGGARGVFGDRIGPADELVLWNGGIWPWLDAPTAVRAITALAARRPGVKLVFMGGPGKGLAGQSAFAEAQEVARVLGALDTTVLFADGWVPYAERADWLLQADCALATAGDHLETRFAFRTRLLDCFWAGLPVVCTTGDDLADRVALAEAGAVAAPGDVEGLASAVEQVLDRGREAFAEPLAALAAASTWPVAGAPLRAWVLAGTGSSERRPGASRRPAHLARNAAYRATRSVLERTGIGWPSQ